MDSVHDDCNADQDWAEYHRLMDELDRELDRVPEEPCGSWFDPEEEDVFETNLPAGTTRLESDYQQVVFVRRGDLVGFRKVSSNRTCWHDVLTLRAANERYRWYLGLGYRETA